jgi:hypothetical protein
VLEHRQVQNYLLQQRMLTQAAMVDGGVSVLDASRRNANFEVTVEGGPSYLLKHATDREKQAALANEAAIYRLLGTTPAARYVPRLHFYDPGSHVLALELLHDAPSWTAYQGLLGRFPTGLAAVLGEALACVHGIDPGGRPARGRAVGTCAPPWALSLHRPDVALYAASSSANHQVISIVQQFPAFGALLDALRAEWQPSSLVHGDLKWDNLLAKRRPGGPGRTVALVDWELAGLGDPCWDMGSAFAGYLGFWLGSIPFSGQESPERYLELARYPLARMQPALRALWAGYARRMRLDDSTSDQWLIRSVRYAAVRLLQSVFEDTRPAVQVTGSSLAFLQVCLNILSQPQVASLHLLGIPPHRIWSA